jgi:hypothetical protein
MQIRNQFKRPRDWKIVAGAGALATVGVAGFALSGPLGAEADDSSTIRLEHQATITDAPVPAPLPANGVVSLADIADDLDSPFDDGGRGGGGGDDSPNDSPPRRSGGGGDDSPNDSAPPGGGGGGNDSPDNSPASPTPPPADSPDDSPASPASPPTDSPDDSPASPDSPDGSQDS